MLVSHEITRPGYKLSVVGFENGEPVEPSTSKTAAVDILSNGNLNQCYSQDNCFRPVGLAWDSKGRLFMSSDTTGEIYVISRSDGSPTSSAGSNSTGSIPGQSGQSGQSATGTGSGSSPSQTGMATATSASSMSALAIVFGILAYML